MSAQRLVGWTMLAVWGTWLCSLQGLVAAHTPLGAAFPELGVVLLFACAARFDYDDVPKAALLLATARAASSIEPPVAILAAYLGAAIALRAIGTVAELWRPLVRSVLAGIGGLGVAAWLRLVHLSRDGLATDGWQIAGALAALWGIGLSSALAGLVLGPALPFLPGLSPLRRRRW